MIDFISNKYLNPTERKKAVELAFRELGENSSGMTKKEHLREKLTAKLRAHMDKSAEGVEAQKFDQKSGAKSNEEVSIEINTHKASRNGEGLPDYLDPKFTSQFLLAYNQDPILKYTCHEIDEIEIVEDICKLCGTEKYHLEAHQQLILKAFNDLQKDTPIPSNVKGLISAYINGTGLWSSSRIKTNWKSTDLLNWSRLNSNRVPNPGLNLINKLKYNSFSAFKPFNSGLTGNRIRNFSELSIFFKYLFHIRSDNSLKGMITNINENKGWNAKAEFDFPKDEFWENMEVFTHIEQIIHAYKKIVGLIFEYVDKRKLDKPVIHFSLREDGETKIFAIHHKNSIYGHTLNDTVRRMGESYTYIINKYINGICDFYLRADFGNKDFAEINLWDEKIMKPKMLDHFEGVQYILIFKL